MQIEKNVETNIQSDRYPFKRKQEVYQVKSYLEIPDICFGKVNSKLILLTQKCLQN